MLWLVKVTATERILIMFIIVSPYIKLQIMQVETVWSGTNITFQILFILEQIKLYYWRDSYTYDKTCVSVPVE